MQDRKPTILRGNEDNFRFYLKTLIERGNYEMASGIWRSAKVVLDHNGEPLFHWFGPKL